MTQRDTNPYPYTDSKTRYMTYDWYLKKRFGGKVARIALDQGCTCPNIDGTRGRGGCIFCSNGSGSAVGGSLTEQYEHGREVACRKWDPIGFIPYFQAHTNTWGDPAAISRALNRASEWEGALMIAVATRADAITEELTGCLTRLARKIPLTVELGLQTSDDEVARRINRCHTWDEFRRGYERLRRAADRVNGEFRGEMPADGVAVEGLPMKRFQIGVHLINGLPGESTEQMVKTAEDAASLEPEMIKLHVLHVLRGTKLAGMYEAGEYTPMERETYVMTVCDQLERIPAETVVGRITADAPAEELISPLWTVRKTEVANEVDKELYRRGSWQGKRRGLC